MLPALYRRDQVTAGQVLVTLDPVDIDAKLAAQQALLSTTHLVKTRENS
jgi:multidrug resistance efflux pump